MEYRVRKTRGLFYIEVKTKSEKWVLCDDDGYPIFASLWSPIIPLNPFNTLKQAQKMIKQFKTPDEYFYENNSNR